MWWAAVLEILRKAVPIIADRIKGNGTDVGPMVRKIDERTKHTAAQQAQLEKRFEVQEGYMAELIAELKSRPSDG